jgi:putative sterol carrier protein
MATEGEVKEAVDSLIARLEDVDPAKMRNLPDRSIGIYLLDLDITYTADIKSGRLQDIRRENGDRRPQVRLVCSSDDLIAMNNGDLHFAHAWATGQIRLDASLRDLLRLRALA